jgi:hypothetical protein
MKHGVDRASVLTPDDINSLNADGLNISWVAAYIGGPRSAASGWDFTAVELLHRMDIGLLPVYVGRNYPWDDIDMFTDSQGAIDANDAVAAANAMGFNSGPLTLDVEANTFDAHGLQTVEYVRGWCVTVRDAGYQAGVYGPPRLIQVCREWDLINFGWAAFWRQTGDAWLRLSQDWPDVSSLTADGLEQPPELWQFVGDVPLLGGIDLSVARDDFAFAFGTPALPPASESQPEPQPLSGELLTLAQTLAYDAGQVQAPIAAASELEPRLGKVEADVQAIRDFLDQPAAAAHELPVPEQPQPAADPEPAQYLVEPGDSLSVIAAKLGHPGEWQALADANPFISDPNLIHPGEALDLPQGW